MNFEVVDTNHLPPAMRWKIASDADVCVAEVKHRTWADHICALLNASGEDHEPTPQEVYDEEEAYQEERHLRAHLEEQHQLALDYAPRGFDGVPDFGGIAVREAERRYTEPF